MADIKKYKEKEMIEIIDFYYFIEDFGHIFHFDSEKLNEPFDKIIKGINEVRKMIEDSYEM